MPGPAPIKERYLLPQTVESVTAERIEQTTNVVDTEDAVKYMPSLFVRKRNAGDNQAVLATRSWGLSSSARTLIYADDILLSSLIGNNNSNAAAALGHGRPGGDQAHRFPVRAVFGGLSRQFHGRRAQHHDADAGQVREDAEAVGVVPELQLL
jgi:hypothetical protein